ncbi:molybdopterin cofactor-binding domain-containing protein [Pleionea sp. CnH1-48]|uniref:molybdopterin cofactor-binding domain-containing protein n=1 Tax=Pleionea sp. CnH1-48 TaxID=2954494 RepID=UPI002096E6E8|nr:molybdopterin cofactor-binding domain-containing protein [Pleionea sp. CnH1-48]MCO7227552.1 molybdopterin-dependent oxidoreductase [Pleionea sp. CnH1-48]
MRIDALDKVLGKKIYVRDLRSQDIKIVTNNQEDWGNVTWHALILRSSYLNRTFIDLNLTEVQKYSPIKCFIRQGDLFRNKLDSSESYELDFGFGLFGATPEVDLFVDEGQSARYVGQPIALLLFDDVAKFLNAEREQLGVRNLVNYGPLTTPSPTAYEESNPISSALDDWLAFGAIPPTEKLFGGQGVDVGERDDSRFPTIERSFDEGTVLELRSSTPTIDPCYLEPDACLGKVIQLDDGKYDLVMYTPTQSPISDEGAINASLKRNITGSKIDVRTLQLGGGFGGRDFSIFPIYGAIV